MKIKQSLLVTAVVMIIALQANAQLKVLTTGNVGIGNNSPLYKLDIYGGSTNGIKSYVNQTYGYGYGILSSVTHNDTKAIAVQLNGSDKFVIYGNGNGWFSNSWLWSDKTLKENIDTLKGALSKVLKLHGYTYNFKSSVTGERSPKKHVGLLAQEVEAVLPEAVATNDNGLKGIAYQNIVALLIEAIKEQNKNIANLETQLSYCCISQQTNSNGNGNSINAAVNDSPRLLQNNPNPFSQQTNIGYYLPKETKSASVMIFDMQGKLVKTIAVTAFENASLTINANELSAGMFMYSLVADGKEVDSKRMILTQ